MTESLASNPWNAFPTYLHCTGGRGAAWLGLICSLGAPLHWEEHRCDLPWASSVPAACSAGGPGQEMPCCFPTSAWETQRDALALPRDGSTVSLVWSQSHARRPCVGFLCAKGPLLRVCCVLSEKGNVAHFIEVKQSKKVLATWTLIDISNAFGLIP